MDTSKLFVCYLRDSGGEDQDLSVEQQAEAVRAWCVKHGYQLGRIFRDEAAPGSSIVGRSAFQEMIHYFRSGEAEEKGIIVWKYSRFSRDIDDAQFYKADLRRLGYEIVSINDNVPDGLNGRLFEAAIDWMNARFLEDLSTDVKRGLRHIVENHAAIPGTPPKGFKREPVEIGKRRDGRAHIVHRWVPDETLWSRCRQAWEMRAAGEPYSKIHKKTRLFGSLNSYSDFFKNEIYIGRLIFGDLVIEDYCEPLISQETWDVVQRMNKKNQKKYRMSGDNPHHPRRAGSSYLLSGLAYCGYCGSPLNGMSVMRRNGNPDHVNNWFYYRCSEEHRKRTDCPALKIPQATLEQAVLDNVIEIILDPDNLAEILQAIEHDQTALKEEVEPKRIDLAHQLAAVKQKIERITSAIAEVGHSKALVQKLSALEGEELEIRSDLVEIEMIARENPPKIWPEQIGMMSDELREILFSEDEAGKREILQTMIYRVDVKREGKMISGTIWYYWPENPKKKLMSMNSTPLGAHSHRHKFQISFTAQIGPRKRRK